MNLIQYDADAERIKEDIKIELLREKEREIEKIKQEAKENAMMLNGFNPRY
jgi:osmotically-inducible protein OsmY